MGDVLIKMFINAFKIGNDLYFLVFRAMINNGVNKGGEVKCQIKL